MAFYNYKLNYFGAGGEKSKQIEFEPIASSCVCVYVHVSGQRYLPAQTSAREHQESC